MTTYLSRLFGGLAGDSDSRAYALFDARESYHPRALVEGLEAREMFSAAPMVASHGAAAHAASRQATVQPLITNARKLTNVLPLKITGIQVQNGQLVALGKLGSQTFTAPLTITPAQQPAGPQAAATTPILNLHLGAIHLNLLGLKVDTSEICLNVGAQSGSGNLLGNLLTSVANLLNGGTPLGSILGGTGALTTTQVNNLLAGLTSLLNGALGAVTAPTALAGVGGTGTSGAAATNILHLSLGPVDLNLLGLTVHLDNCNNGPVTVDVTAQPGPGNLLGNLLGNLSHLLDTPANQSALVAHLRGIAQQIAALI